ncbi:non-homologous end-joining DNA ligase [Actinopolymorpha pittospori]|uniref:DNA ligase (ATP) n=1 Tax=Actinopolymorpha pittospori TaxID=648752 RepID=A0A927RKG6_9ACTN|nr:bifunctional non-homologous end joining protein LigD [Actinopolymorpha pittospori]
MPDKLAEYRRKRSAERTPEPIPAEGPLPHGDDDTFVIQEHHARRLHWDFRLERDGVLVSWALPKGLPTDPKKNHLAVHTEDHPLEYAAFAGEIGRGEYGAGTVEIWDRGTYECEKWTDREVKVVLHGTRANGRFVVIRTGADNNWLIHRMADTPAQSAPEPDSTGSTDSTGGARKSAGTKKAAAKKTGTTKKSAAKKAGAKSGAGRSGGTEPMPRLIRPMLATLGELPPAGEDEKFGYEMKWDGLRAVAYADGRQVRLLTRNDIDVTATYPELAPLQQSLGSLRAVLDGEIVALDQKSGRISFAALQARMHVRNAAQIRRLAEEVPVTYLIFDLLHLDGRSTLSLPYDRRRELLESLDLRGEHWDTPPRGPGRGADALAISKEQGLEGIMAKRLSSHYEPGRRSRDWVKVKHTRTQEVVVGGWRPGKGRRTHTLGSLLLGIQGPDGLEYVGQVGTGFTEEMLDDLLRRLRRLERRTSPFAGEVPTRDTKDAQWVTPKLVGEVRFTEWTRDHRLRHPAWRGLRPDKAPEDVVRES